MWVQCALTLACLLLSSVGVLANAQQQVFVSSDPQPPAPIIDEGLNAYVEQLMVDDSAKGLSMAVIRSDGEVEYGSWGISTESGEKVVPETLFGIASSSKAFTAAAIGILMDDFELGRNTTPLPSRLSSINQNTRFRDLLPDAWSVIDCNNGDPKCFLKNHDSLHWALSNVFQLPSQLLSYSEQDSIVDILRRREHLDLFTLPNQQYSDIMYMAAAHVVSLYSGKSFPKLVQERIFDQLGMNSTTYSPNKAEASGLFSNSWTSSGRRIPFYQTDETLLSHAGPNGVISNVVDLAKWAKLMMNDGIDPRTKNRILSEESYRFISVPSVHTGKDGALAYAKGWTIYKYQGMKVLSHIGQLQGANSMVAFLPDQDFGVVVLANSNVSFLNPLFLRILQKAFHPNDMASIPDEVIYRSCQNQRLPFGSSMYDEKIATPKLPLASYAGVYSNPGYGSFRLCSSNSTPIIEECADVLESFRIVDASSDDNHGSSSQLLASWPRMWSTHLRFSLYEDNIFSSSIRPPTLFTSGYGMDTTPFQITGLPGEEFCIRFVVQYGEVLGLEMMRPSVGLESCATAEKGYVLALFIKVS